MLLSPRADEEWAQFASREHFPLIIFNYISTTLETILKAE
jgi:hypothetical protein